MENTTGSIPNWVPFVIPPSFHILNIDYSHPLFLHSSDVSRMQIISFKLTDIKNSTVWARSMHIELFVRNKIGLVDHFCSKEKFPKVMWNH